MPRVLTASLVTSLLTCPYKGALEYLGWRTNEEKDSLEFGTKWHAWIEKTLKTGKPDFINTDLPVGSLKSWFWQAKDLGLFDLEFQPEQETIVEIHPNLWIAVKCDGISTKTGKNILLENKTDSWVTNDYFVRKTVEAQPLMYVYGFDADVIHWNVYNKKTGEVRFDILPNIKKEEALQLILHADDLLVKGLQGLKVRGHACFDWYRKYCPYYELCYNQDSSKTHRGEFNRFSEYSDEMRSFILNLIGKNPFTF